MSIPLPPPPVPADYQILVLGERWAHCARMIHDAAAKRDPSTARILHSADQLRARDLEIAECVLQAAAKVLTEHQIPVGNSAAGELACEMTYDALKECRDTIKSLEFHHE